MAIILSGGLVLLGAGFLVYKPAIDHSKTHYSQPPQKAVVWTTIEDQEVKKLQTIAHDHGSAAALEYLKTTWGKTQAKAHYLSHIVGELAYQEQGTKAFSVCDASFAFGCYHGLVGELIKDKGEQGVVIAQQACHQLGSKNTVTGCIHGLGHGIMEWKADIPAAITACRKLGAQEDGNCFDGVYMEYGMDILKIYPPKPVVTSNNPWQFCQNEASDAYPWCIRNQTIYLLATHSIPASATIKGCDLLSGSARTKCVGSVGVFVADKNAITNQGIVDFCSQLDQKSDSTYCVFSAVQELLFQERDALRASQLCNQLGTSWRAQCSIMITGDAISLPVTDMNGIKISPTTQ